MYLTTPALWPALVAFLALAIPLLIHDARAFRLPLALNAGLLGAGLVLIPVAGLWIGRGPVLRSLLGAGVMLTIMLLLFVLARGALGFGDVILATGLALYAGIAGLLLALAGLWTGCVLTLVWSRLRRRRGDDGPVPFGPGLIMGAALVMLVPLPGLGV